MTLADPTHQIYRPPQRGGAGAGGGGRRNPAAADDATDVLVPGIHPNPGDRGHEEVSEEAFAEAFLAAMPRDLLYISSGTPGLLKGSTGEREFDPISATDVRLKRGEFVRLTRRDRDGYGEVFTAAVKCSEDHGKLVVAHARRSERVRRLVRVVQCPVYCRGFVLSPPGWSADGTYFDATASLAGLEPEPEESVIAAVLEDLLVDFPFKDEASRQNFIGLLLTPILRPAINGNVPLHLVLASLERTGKTKLLEEVLGGVIFGRPTPALQMTGSDEELDKRVVSLLGGGKTLLHLDNLGQYLDSPILASLLTSTTYLGRELGKSKMLELPNTLILTASGNNVRATGELVKRTVPVQLQPRDGHPEDRTDFVHPDLREYVASVRPAVLSVLLGMVERWKAAGRPGGARPMGGFENWARVVGGVMAANGFDQWLGNAAEWRRSADPDGEDLQALVTEWAREHGSSPLTTTELLKLAQAYDLFPTVMRRSSAAAVLSSFSKSVLARNVDRPVNGLVIARNASGNNNRYHLQGDAAAFEQARAAPARESVPSPGGEEDYSIPFD